jgi:hypothetical protein
MSRSLPSPSSYPPEILDHILEELPRSDVYTALSVSKAFYAVGVRILYRSLVDLKPQQSIACLESLHKNSANALLVRKLELDWTKYQLISNLLRLLHKVLQSLTLLTALSIEFSADDNQRPVLWIFDQCNFSLKYLSISTSCCEALARFLDLQPHLTELCLRGFQSSYPFLLPTSSIPLLRDFRVVLAGPSVITEVVRGRPVEGVSLSLFEEDGFLSLDALNLSANPIKKLSILYFGQKPLNDLLPAISIRMPQLEGLHIISSMASCNRDLLVQSSSLLSEFKLLKFLTLIAPGDAFSIDEEQTVATLWHESCPTLKTIIMPKGLVWFDREGEWTCLEC